MEKFKHARLFSTDQKLFVECNKEEMPKKEDYTDSLGFFKHRYNRAVEEWKRNCKTVEVHPSEVERCKDFAAIILGKKLYKWITPFSMQFEPALQQGIMLPPYSVRITEAIIPRPKTGMGVNHNEWKEYAFLSEESSETQGELWDEIVDEFQKWVVSPKGSEPFSERVKSKFEIKRKQG